MVFVGLDVGKGEHHACALAVDGTRLHDRALPDNEAALRQVLSGLAEHGQQHLAAAGRPVHVERVGVARLAAVGQQVPPPDARLRRRDADVGCEMSLATRPPVGRVPGARP